MYAAKADGRGVCRFFESEMAAQAYAALVLEGQLAQALQRNEFALMLQPRVALDGSGLQVQALIRWHHPDRGWLAPESFFEVAEERRLMQPIVRWALREAIAAQRGWARDGRPAARLALDLSSLPLPLEAVRRTGRARVRAVAARRRAVARRRRGGARPTTRRCCVRRWRACGRWA